MVNPKGTLDSAEPMTGNAVPGKNEVPTEGHDLFLLTVIAYEWNFRRITKE